MVALAWSRQKLLDQDEVFVLQTDTVPSVAQLLHIQLHTPISLDPPVYHLLAHVAARAFGPTAFALRLPSLGGFLLMQLCLFLYVRGVANERAALLAAGLPTLTATLLYAAEARPYGLLLGWFALTLVAYQRATRAMQDVKEAHGLAPKAIGRGGALTMLALGIGLALNTHYFGVLLVIPVYAAELARTVAHRRLDMPVVVAILAGTATFGLTIPFQRAAAEFRIHYYNVAQAGPRAITQAYRSLFLDYTHDSLRAQHLIAMFFVVLAICFLTALAARWKSFGLPPGEAVFLLTLATLPFFGYMLARFVTHTIEVRYVLGALIGIVVLAALLAAPLLERGSLYAAAMVILPAAIFLTGIAHVRMEARNTAAVLASLRPSATLEAALAADPRRMIYIQEVGRFEEARYNMPDGELRDRLALVYSAEREIRIDGHDTEALTAENLAQFSSLRIVRYEQLLADPSPHIVLIDPPNGWQWMDRTLAEDGMAVRPVAPWFGGEAAMVGSAKPQPAR